MLWPVNTLIRPISISDLARPILHFQRSASSASFTNQNQVQPLSCTDRRKGAQGLHDQGTKVSSTHLLCSRIFAWHLSQSPWIFARLCAQEPQDMVERGEKPYCIMINIHRYPITCLVISSVFSRGRSWWQKKQGGSNHPLLSYPALIPAAAVRKRRMVEIPFAIVFPVSFLQFPGVNERGRRGGFLFPDPTRIVH